MKKNTTKKRRKPTEAQKKAAAEKRAKLCRMTAPYRELVEFNKGIAAAMILDGLSEAAGKRAMEEHAVSSGFGKEYAGCFTLNACLVIDYQKQTGQTEWKTFKGWKEEGTPVKKGEKGFIIWGQPRTMKATSETENPETGETETTEKRFESFPICYLFHAGQVEAAKPREEDAENIRNISDLSEGEEPKPGELLKIA